MLRLSENSVVMSQSWAFKPCCMSVTDSADSSTFIPKLWKQSGSLRKVFQQRHRHRVLRKKGYQELMYLPNVTEINVPWVEHIDSICFTGPEKYSHKTLHTLYDSIYHAVWYRNYFINFLSSKVRATSWLKSWIVHHFITNIWPIISLQKFLWKERGKLIKCIDYTNVRYCTLKQNQILVTLILQRLCRSSFIHCRHKNLGFQSWLLSI